MINDMFMLEQRRDGTQLTQETVEQHIISENKNSHICSICLKMSKTRGDARKHIRLVHLKERNHHCPYCGASFFKKWNVTQHEKICKARL